MAYRFRRFREISRVLRHFHSDAMSRRKLPATFTTSLLHEWPTTRDRVMEFKDKVRRFSVLSETQNDLIPQAEILNFIKSTIDELEGPNHHWLNYMDLNGASFNQDGIFLVLVNAYVADSTLLGRRDRIIMFERVKLLQQRYPKLNVFGLQCGNSVKSVATQNEIIQTIMEEYITFPILISDKHFTRMTNGACYLLFKGSTSCLFHHKLDVDLGDIFKVIEEFEVSQNDNAIIFQNSNGDRMRQHEFIKEPCVCSSFRNLLLHYPGCVSVDEDGNRLFISDSNHHRIIITDGDGKILDCIGSSPGFEDGEFESAKLLRPAASFYNDAEDCLYFVDSENNAIRRADLERRMLETMFPVSVPKTSGVWSWILEKLGLARDIDVKPEEFDLDSFTSPWHLLNLGENDLVIINRSFEMSWFMSMSTWEIKKVTKGIQNILDNYRHMIVEKVALLRNTYGTSSSHRLNNCLSLEGIPYAGLMSSVANFQNYTIFCDVAGHRVLKCHKQSRAVSYIQFSDLRVLGLPYWLVCPLERVFNSGYLCRPWNEHLHYFSVLPGRCDIRVNVDIPKGTELAAPLEEECIWRQARGSAAELSGYEGAAACTEKVGVAQQWFDELDNLAFSKSSMESGPQLEENVLDRSFQDTDKVHFDCAVNISPGTSEVVVSAVLYLKLSKAQGIEEQRLEAMRILDTQKEGNKKPEEDACISLLSETCGDLRDLVFMKPLHLRIRLECGDHPTATTQKETITTDTNLEVNVSLD